MAQAGNLISVGFCPAGQHVYALIDEKQLVFWELINGDACPALVQSCQPINADPNASFTWNNSRYSVYSVGTNEIVFNDDDKGRSIGRFVGHTGIITGISVQPAKDRMLTGAFDKTIRLWDLRMRQELQSFSLGAPVTCVALSDLADFALCGCNDRSVALWKT